MFEKLCCVAVALFSVSSAAHPAEPGATLVPTAVIALKGCWEGRGEVMGKPVTISVVARPIVQDAMWALEAESSAVADTRDSYSAHLVFGGANRREAAADQIVGYWADSFGGAFAASGRGESRSDGFDMTYRYPDNDFVNRWRFLEDRLTWRIAARDGKGIEKPFASYSLHKKACRP